MLWIWTQGRKFYAVFHDADFTARTGKKSSLWGLFFRERFYQQGAYLLQKQADDLQIFSSLRVGKKPEVTNAVEVKRDKVEHESADKFDGRQGQRFSL